MTARQFGFPLALLLLLAACNEPASPEAAPSRDAATPAGTVPPEARGAKAGPSDVPPPGYTDGSGVNEGYPDLTPAPLTPEAERGEKGARNVLLAFIRAIELKEFDQAYGLMRADAREGLSKAQFTALFDGFGTITVAAPIGQIEGAAGTTYYTAPITISGSNGQELAGEIVLSRVNDVPGASEDQLRWRVRELDLAES